MMELNKIQRLIILVSIFIIILMGLFPPWVHTFKFQNTYSEKPNGYRFIMDPPPKEVPPSKERDSPLYGVKIDTSRFLIQFVVTVTACCLGIILTSGRKD